MKNLSSAGDWNDLKAEVDEQAHLVKINLICSLHVYNFFIVAIKSDHDENYVFVTYYIDPDCR